jgi:AbiTii
VAGYQPHPEAHQALLQALRGSDDLRIRLEIPQIVSLLSSVRNILLNWTLELEKCGILGENLMFSSDDRERSASITNNTVSNIHISQVGSFVQNATDAVVSGSVEANVTTSLAKPTLDFIQEVEAILPVSNLPIEIRGQTQIALSELKEAAAGPKPDDSRLRRGLESLKRILAPAGETLVKLAVDAAVSKLLGSHQ